jgi:hypothetical protein
MESRRKDAWSPEQDQIMIELREQRKSWKEVGAILGRTVESCCARYRSVVPASRRQRFVSARYWSPEEEATLKALLEERRSPRQISHHMGKDIKVIYSKIQQLRQPGREIHIERLPRVRVPEHQLIDRDRRLAVERDITAEFFGDPPRGWSALDKKQGEYA